MKTILWIIRVYKRAIKRRNKYKRIIADRILKDTLKKLSYITADYLVQPSLIDLLVRRKK